MSKLVIGTFPEKVSYVYVNHEIEVSVGSRYDFYDTENPKGSKISIKEGFVADPANSYMLSRIKNTVLSQYRFKKVTAQDLQISTIDNSPIKEIELLNFNHYARIAKVKVNGFLMDLKEEVITDCVINSGIETGGKLKGEFVWAHIGNSLSLVRVGSELHRLIGIYDARKDLKRVKKRELVPGNIYQNIKLEKALYLGKFSTVILRERFVFDESRNRYVHDNKNFDFNSYNDKNTCLFYKFNNDLNIETNTNNFLNNLSNVPLSQFSMADNHQYVESIGQIDFEPSKIEEIRQHFLNHIKNMVLEFTGNAPQKRYYRVSSWMLKSEIARYSKFFHLHVTGEEAPPVFNVNDWLIFS